MTGKRALVVATDPVVLDEVLRLAAVANCEIERVPDLYDARVRWKDAPLVLIDEAAVIEHDPVTLPPRKDVLVICKGPPEPRTWQCAFAVGAQQVLSLPDDETAVLKAFAEIVDGPPRPGGRVLTVVGGCGGAGATVLAAGLATAAARSGEHTLLLDCDPLSGGLDVLLGAENHQHARWPDLRVNSGRILLSALEDSLPHHDCTPPASTLLTRFRPLPTTTAPRRTHFAFLSSSPPSTRHTPNTGNRPPAPSRTTHRTTPSDPDHSTPPPNSSHHPPSLSPPRPTSSLSATHPTSSVGATRPTSSLGAPHSTSSLSAARPPSSLGADRRASPPGARRASPSTADHHSPHPHSAARPSHNPDLHIPPLNGEAIATVIEAARRAGRFVICDLPRHLGNGSAEAAARADLALVVVPLNFRACIAAKRVVALLRGTGAEIRLVARGPARSGPSAKQVAAALDIPLLAEYRQEFRLNRGAFHPRPRGPLLTVAASALAALPRQEFTP
ncbi:septum site-determining protein Ssd [Amycolatopsis sp. 195334CR]|uniref:septum site-determining protein Ssd n=1 Tax=Amycolatopsis sp. 195334CR TaxID=2814588 RepID=UPI001A8C3DE4|nr:septum site-determining protein Ssd [Amycolatopsis sp. 195334CR]MBN6035126.1 hypothetical protein [Amycolatopsis sp. 195334CR]